MSTRSTSRKSGKGQRGFFAPAGRAYGGAILFSFPILVTMEMWSLGASLDGFRLGLFLVLSIPLVCGLSYYDGFEDTSSFYEDIVDTFVAFAVGFSTSASILVLFNLANYSMSRDEIAGKIVLLAIPTTLGAVLAQSLLLGEKNDETISDERKGGASYAGQLFLMIAGGVFFSMSVAPTEEMTLISYTMTDWHAVAVILLSIAVMHGFIHAVERSGHSSALSPAAGEFSIFARYTVVGYAVALVMSYYILWTFGSLDGMGTYQQLKATIVLGVPAAVGASASRLII